MPDLKVCVVVPTYNERENVGALVERIRGTGSGEADIMFVDDSSPDGTAEAVREMMREDPRLHLLVRGSKKGIGGAYIDGFREALRTLGPDVLVQIDADLQHPPAVIPLLVGSLSSGAGAAIASRYVRGGGSKGWSMSRRLVSRVANSYARTLLRLPVKDCTSGFRAMTRQSATRLVDSRLPARGFEFQVASVYVLKTGVKILEVPFIFEPRRIGSSKLGLPDVLRFMAAVLRLAIRPPRTPPA